MLPKHSTDSLHWARSVDCRSEAPLKNITSKTNIPTAIIDMLVMARKRILLPHSGQILVNAGMLVLHFGHLIFVCSLLMACCFGHS